MNRLVILLGLVVLWTESPFVQGWPMTVFADWWVGLTWRCWVVWRK